MNKPYSIEISCTNDNTIFNLMVAKFLKLFSEELSKKYYLRKVYYHLKNGQLFLNFEALRVGKITKEKHEF